MDVGDWPPLAKLLADVSEFVALDSRCTLPAQISQEDEALSIAVMTGLLQKDEPNLGACRSSMDIVIRPILHITIVR